MLVCVAATLLYRKFDIDTVHDYATGLNGGVVFLLLTVLPMVGFPVTVLHVVVGMRFGIPLGLALVALSIALQLLASYLLVYFFRDAFARRFEPIRRRIPKGAHGPVCVFTMLLPGVPYFAKNYVLPLLGVPFRTYLLICLPIHILRSSIAIALGDMSDELTPTRIAWLTVYYGATLGVSWWMFRRIRAQMGKNHSARGRASTAQPKHA